MVILAPLPIIVCVMVCIYLFIYCLTDLRYPEKITRRMIISSLRRLNKWKYLLFVTSVLAYPFI